MAETLTTGAAGTGAGVVVTDRTVVGVTTGTVRTTVDGVNAAGVVSEPRVASTIATAAPAIATTIATAPRSTVFDGRLPARPGGGGGVDAAGCGVGGAATGAAAAGSVLTRRL